MSDYLMFEWASVFPQNDEPERWLSRILGDRTGIARFLSGTGCGRQWSTVCRGNRTIVDRRRRDP